MIKRGHRRQPDGFSWAKFCERGLLLRGLRAVTTRANDLWPKAGKTIAMAKTAEDDTSPELQAYYLEVGKRVRSLRKAKKWTQPDLAERAGVHFTYIAQVERLGINASVKTLYRLAAALEVPPSDLLPGGATKSKIDYEHRYHLLTEKLRRIMGELDSEKEMDAAAIEAEGEPHH
jgi:transcriptional regulator with XRE-family HTH domain